MSDFRKIGLAIGFLVSFYIGFQLNSYGQLLWKIEGNGLEKPSYLYGTIHVTDQRVFQFGDSVLSKFDETDAFAGEMLFDNSMGMMMETISFMMMPNDTTLADLLPENQYIETKRYLEKEFGFMTSYLLRFKPILVSTLLTEQRNNTSNQTVSTDMILDLYFQQLAQEKKKEVIGLETFAEQAQAFDGMPLKQQAEMLYQQITAPEPPENTYEKLLQLYLQENLDSLYAYTISELDSNSNQKLLIDRNIKMTNRAIKLMQEKTLFIGVGAAHLPGEQGLIQLLRNQGYLVEPVEKNIKK